MVNNSRNEKLSAVIWLCIKTPCCCGSSPLLQAFVGAGYCKPVLNILPQRGVAFWEVCREGVCRRTPPSVTNLCRDMAAQACYKPNVFDHLPYELGYICLAITVYTSHIINTIAQMRTSLLFCHVLIGPGACMFCLNTAEENASPQPQAPGSA